MINQIEIKNRIINRAKGLINREKEVGITIRSKIMVEKKKKNIERTIRSKINTRIIKYPRQNTIKNKKWMKILYNKMAKTLSMIRQY